MNVTSRVEVNIELIVSLLEQASISASNASCRAGLAPSYLGHLICGRRNCDKVRLNTICRLADVLQVPWQALLRDRGSGQSAAKIVEAHRWDRSDRFELFHERLIQAHDHLVLTERIDGYLFPNEQMWRWAWSKYRPVLFIDPSEEVLFWQWSERIVEMQRRARHDNNYRHTVISPSHFFRSALDFEPTFIPAALEHIRKFDPLTTVHIIPSMADWTSIRRQIGIELMKLLGLPLKDWDCVFVRDDFLAGVRTDSSNYLYCYDQTIVQSIRRAILKLPQVAAVTAPAARERTATFLSQL